MTLILLAVLLAGIGTSWVLLHIPANVISRIGPS
jgi:hypothetical protein